MPDRILYNRQFICVFLIVFVTFINRIATKSIPTTNSQHELDSPLSNSLKTTRIIFKSSNHDTQKYNLTLKSKFGM